MKVGVIGGGQLGQMLAEAAKPLGVDVVCLDPNAECPASTVTKTRVAEFDDLAALQALADETDVLTFEFENVSVETLEKLNATIHPNTKALYCAQHRGREKKLFNDLKIPTTQYIVVNSEKELEEKKHEINYPAIAKTCRFGYDGKGQTKINAEDEVLNAFVEIGSNEILIEEKINFDREVSIIAARDKDAHIVFYPLIENIHENGILNHSIAPARDRETLQKKAEAHIKRVMDHFNYVGVLTIEFFVKVEELIANEMAPRVHNSGHYSIEGAETSQFENHIRAVCNLPLKSTAEKKFAVMLNVIGEHKNIKDEAENTHFHDYHKTEKPGRKLAHVTHTFDTRKEQELFLSTL